MLINPAAKPMDEVHRFLSITVNIFLNKSHVWTYTREDMEDIFQACYMVAFRRLLEKVRKGTYRRDLSFYLNCRSCAWSAVSPTLAVLLPRIQRSHDLASLYDSVPGCGGNEKKTYAEVISNKPCWRTVGEIHREQTKKRYPAKNLHRVWRNEIDAEYYEYLDDCSDYSVEPLSKNDYIQENYEDWEYELYFYNQLHPGCSRSDIKRKKEIIKRIQKKDRA